MTWVDDLSFACQVYCCCCSYCRNWYVAMSFSLTNTVFAFVRDCVSAARMNVVCTDDLACTLDWMQVVHTSGHWQEATMSGTVNETDSMVSRFGVDNCSCTYFVDGTTVDDVVWMIVTDGMTGI